MRVVLDPGVLVSAVVAPNGPCAQLLDLATQGRFRIVVSDKLLGELARVLRRERFRPFLSLEEADEFVAALRQAAELEQDPSEAPAVTRDPKDDYLVALAVSTGADALVSGDRDLADLSAPPVLVRTPRSLLETIES